MKKKKKFQIKINVDVRLGGSRFFAPISNLVWCTPAVLSSSFFYVIITKPNIRSLFHTHTYVHTYIYTIPFGEPPNERNVNSFIFRQIKIRSR